MGKKLYGGLAYYRLYVVYSPLSRFIFQIEQHGTGNFTRIKLVVVILTKFLNKFF
jgi:hypothetical protein